MVSDYGVRFWWIDALEDWGNFPMNSQSTMLAQAAQLLADLHQRASFDTPALLRELILGAAQSVPGAQYAGITFSERRRRSQATLSMMDQSI
jgi:hypothetical protein